MTPPNPSSKYNDCQHANMKGLCWICKEDYERTVKEKEFEANVTGGTIYRIPATPSRREIAVQFALKMTGQGQFDRETGYDFDSEVARRAVKLADALLAELEKGKTNEH